MDAALRDKESYQIKGKYSNIAHDLWRARASQIVPFTEEALFP